MHNQRAEISFLVNQLLDRSGSDVQIELKSFFPGNRLAGGKYSMRTHTITLYIEEIKDQCVHMFSSLEYFMDYLKVVLAHEIGHAEDKDLEFLADLMDECLTEKGRRKVALRIEENAWEYAKNLIPEIEQAFIGKIIFHSLQSYRTEIQSDIA